MVYLAVLVVVVEQIAVRVGQLPHLVKAMLAGLVALNLVAMLLAVAAVLVLLVVMQPLP
jgi:hypothetical protein